MVGEIIFGTGLAVGLAGAVCKAVGEYQDEQKRKEEEQNEKKD